MNIQRKIAVALPLDPLFKSYQLAWAAEEAIEFAKQIPSLGKASSRALVRLIQGINADVPALKAVGHVYRIGRRRGRRLVEFDINPWSKDFEVARQRIDVLIRRAGAELPDTCLDEGKTTFGITWK